MGGIMALAAACLLLFSASQAPVEVSQEVLEGLPVLDLVADDTTVDRSCRVRIAPDMVLTDRGQPGVVQIVASGVTVVFEDGSVLRGAPAGTPQDTLEGIGVQVVGVADVTVVGLHAEGFRCGLLAQEADRLTVAGGFFARNFAQRLGSTPAAEDAGDWLWPHENDEAQWRTRYGAAVCVERSEDVALFGIRVRAQQNGLILDRVTGARVYDNDCSFLSGWGLAMWRSRDNLISRNAFDFCIRGYSHGVYNRGQDSAGILCFEQCSGNVFLENSATHGGDGFFGFSGREALGQGPVPDGFDHRRAGNGNLFERNDFSFAAAHGLETTFSFGTGIIENLFEGNAICGIWGGYSQDLFVFGNAFVGNGDAGYGLERGGLNVDHPRGLMVAHNVFDGDRCGVHLWRYPSALEEGPWGQANPADAAGWARDPASGAPSLQLRGNRFEDVPVSVQLRGGVAAELRGNVFLSGEETSRTGRQDMRIEDGAQVLPQRAVARDLVSGIDLPMTPRVEALGRTRPVGARAHLRGREHIVMTEWGPWDHETPLLRPLATSAGENLYRVLPAGTPFEARLEGAGVRLGTEPGVEGDLLRVQATEAGARPYRLHAVVGGSVQMAEGMLLDADWEVRVFATRFDPRADADAWAAARERAWQDGVEGVWSIRVPALDLRFGMGGLPAALLAEDAPPPPREHFGTVARCRVALPAGRWRLATESDDGIRVSVDGALVLDDWTWHAPKRADAAFTLETAREVEILVEHFELDGFAVLAVALEPAD
jgi:hypothetical protein